MDGGVIDRTVFSELEETAGAEFVAELVDSFLQEAPLMLTELREALAVGDVDRFRRAAHSLKSNGNTFGAHTLSSIARDLELSAAEAVQHGGTDRLEPLALEYARVEQALRALRRG